MQSALCVISSYGPLSLSKTPLKLWQDKTNHMQAINTASLFHSLRGKRNTRKKQNPTNWGRYYFRYILETENFYLELKSRCFRSFGNQ